MRVRACAPSRARLDGEDGVHLDRGGVFELVVLLVEHVQHHLSARAQHEHPLSSTPVAPTYEPSAARVVDVVCEATEVAAAERPHADEPTEDECDARLRRGAAD
eukprot:4595962-Pleurochrysis_carterae.AAC.1